MSKLRAKLVGRTPGKSLGPDSVLVLEVALAGYQWMRLQFSGSEWARLLAGEVSIPEIITFSREPSEPEPEPEQRA